MCPASCCSFVTPFLIWWVLSVRNPSVLLVAACFSARLVIWSWRLWIAASIAVMISQLVGSCWSAPLIRASVAFGSSMVRFTM